MCFREVALVDCPPLIDSGELTFHARELALKRFKAFNGLPCCSEISPELYGCAARVCEVGPFPSSIPERGETSFQICRVEATLPEQSLYSSLSIGAGVRSDSCCLLTLGHPPAK